MLKEYQDFYSGKNRKAIFQAFEQLIDAMRQDDFSNIDAICTDDCIADFSTIGRLVGIDSIKSGLQWPGPVLEISKATIWNFVARSQQCNGQQSAYVQCIRSGVEGDQITPFLYGGQFCNSFVCCDGIWKFKHIRFDLCYEYGNNVYVMGKWKLMNHGAYCGHKPMICPELDNPWMVIPLDCEPQSDEEEIFELMYQYAFAFDNGDFHFLKTFTTDDFFINGSAKCRTSCDYNQEPGDYLGFRDVSDFLKDKFKKEAKMIHSCRMRSIKITGDTAVASLSRGEEHRLRNKLINKDNIHSMFSTAIHYLYARKMEGRWMLYKYRIEPVFECVEIPDTYLAYDEYLFRKKPEEFTEEGVHG